MSLLHFKIPGIEDILQELKGLEKYAGAYDILMKVMEYSERELRGEYGSVSFLLAMLAEYLRTDAQHASPGTITYLCNLKQQIKALPLSKLTLFEMKLFQEMIDNIERFSVPSAG